MCGEGNKLFLVLGEALYLGNAATLRAQPYTKFSIGNYFGVSWSSILPRGVNGEGGREGGKVGREIALALAILVKVL